MWDECVDFCVFLTENYRQNEPTLLKILDEFRSCNLSDYTINFIKTNLTRPLSAHPFDIVRLFPHKDKVTEENNKFLDMLPGEQHVYHASDTGSSEVLKNAQFRKTLFLN